ncbi:MAG: hypothetical protein QOD77_732 [Thermoplasmata archaeon]|nr:hypothetical protein [Thermoplasmata archaeon]
MDEPRPALASAATGPSWMSAPMQAPAEAPVGVKLCHIVRASPGIHFRGLERAASLHSNGQLRHHVDRLARQGLLVEVKDGRFSRFFVTDGHEPQLRPGMARLARPVPRQIAQLLLAGPLARTELRRRLGCADSTLGYHLTRMLQAGDLERQGPGGTLYALSPAAQRVLNEAVPASP